MSEQTFWNFSNRKGSLMETKCSVKMLWIWRVYWSKSSRHLTKIWLFSVSSPTFLFPPRLYQPPWAHRAPKKDWEKTKAVLGFWGACFAPELEKLSHSQYLTVPQVKYCKIFGCIFNNKHESLLSKHLCSPMRGNSFLAGISASSCWPTTALPQQSLSDAKAQFPGG